jgi:hypothetical protein
VVSGSSSEAIAVELQRWILEGPWQPSETGAVGREVLVTSPIEGWVGVYDDREGIAAYEIDVWITGS